ncbi:MULTISPECIES: cellulose binding domain-containing protein [Micromonospora]|uniref:Cellulose-binding protein n=1 Tax=Micromonospora maris TaxID=1003110 RepID=A0A9X0LED7_9ACTN|nr:MULTISPECIES: cellulose binding domain-containing protein [Micromonospora]KUJ47187.1 cellulose-binding protein [Micromonospora maris]RUL94478.1 cellulose-binding protein [Verrucosispora sp. FIM060022]
MVRPRSIFGPAAIAAMLVLSVGGVALATGPTATASTTDVGTLAATAGCGRAPGLNSGTHTIQSNGKSRSYILRIPANYNNNHPYRLVLGFHWRGGSAVDVDTGQTVQRDTWSYYGLRQLANNSTIFVAPQGLNAGWANSGGEDVTFVDDLLRQVEANLCVETTQRFALGFSWGGGMSYALACARPNVFRAVAVYAGGLISGCSGGNGRIAYFGAHGIRDNVLGISGGRSLRDRFVNNNGCTPQNPPEPSQGSLTHRTTTYSGCAAGYPVVWAAFDEGHIAAPQDGAPGDSGSRTWLPAETWRFFTQFGSSTPPPTDPTTPPPTDPTTPPPGPTTPPPGGACRVAVTVNAWNNGLTQDLTITNTGGSAINGWSLVFTLPGGQNITGGWNASYSPTSGQVTARNVSYNGSIAPGASVGIGFQATHTGNSARPSSYTLNGATCTIA